MIADLRELDRRTGGPAGARRVCWTPEWGAARDFLRELLEPLPAQVEVDSAGNLWATVAGDDEGTVAIGSHLDSVPAGGWLDGALGVMAAVEVLRSLGSGPPWRTVALVDWADEEGARFGHSLLGSSGFAGRLDAEAAAGLVDADGVTLPAALSAHGVEIEEMNAAGGERRGRLAAYLELHIEQGPVLEGEGRACAAVSGCAGVERHRVSFAGSPAHAGTTPMDRRADAGVAAARAAVGLQEIARGHGGVCTAGRIDLDPGIATAVPGRADLLVDQRHADAGALASMLDDARELWEAAAAQESCMVEADRLWSIEPVPFDPSLVDLARVACGAAGGTAEALVSGALHDAAQVARVCPAAMVFTSSTGGVSHARGEDTPEDDLHAAISAFGSLCTRVIEGDT